MVAARPERHDMRFDLRDQRRRDACVGDSLLLIDDSLLVGPVLVIGCLLVVRHRVVVVVYIAVGVWEE